MNIAPRTPLREPGFWLALLLVVAQAVNAARVAFDAPGFATYFGVALFDAGDAAWVQVYGLRTAFIAAFAAWLLWRREAATLAAFALIALVLPVGDLALAHAAGAPASTLARHAAIAVVLLLAWACLRTWARRLGPH